MKYQVLFLALALINLVSAQTCGPRIRRPWRSLSPQEQQTYVDAVLQLKASGVYDAIVVQHFSSRNSDVAHGTSAFLPWHRWYLWQYENALRSLGGRFACVTVPYWDWELDAANMQNAPIFGSLLGTRRPSNNLEDGSCVTDGSFVNWVTTDGGCLRRVWDGSISLVGEVGVMQAITTARYGDGNRNQGFCYNVENRLHASPHVWIGGHMGTFESPNDPLFFLHHSNVDRLWAIWQDCHDYDQLNYDNFAAGTYAWYQPTYNTDTLLSEMPYRFDNGTADRRFLVNGRFPTPRDLMRFQGNTRVGMDYSYEQNDNMVQLLNDRYGRCNWHIFGNQNGAAQNPPAQDLPAQNPPAQDLPAQNPPAQNPPAQNPPAQNPPAQPRPTTSRPTTPRPNTARPSGPSRPGQPNQNNRTPRPGRPDRNNRPPRTSLPGRQNVLGRQPRNRDDDDDNEGRRQRNRQPANGVLNGAQGGSGNGFLQTVLNTIFRRQKRDIEQTDNVTDSVSRVPTRTYGVVAEGLINQVKKKFKVSHPRVQELIESICDNNPVTKAAPVTDRIWMIAMGECEILGTERHVNERWIKMMHMQNRTEAFKPICPPRSCCKAADMISPNMLCSGGGVARPSCNLNTCQWNYDCGNKTVLEAEIVAQITIDGASRATEESAAMFSYFDSRETIGSTGIPLTLVLGIAVIVLPFIALVIFIVVLYKMRRNAMDY